MEDISIGQHQPWVEISRDHVHAQTSSRLSKSCKQDTQTSSLLSKSCKQDRGGLAMTTVSTVAHFVLSTWCGIICVLDTSTCTHRKGGFLAIENVVKYVWSILSVNPAVQNVGPVGWCWLNIDHTRSYELYLVNPFHWSLLQRSAKVSAPGSVNFILLL